MDDLLREFVTETNESLDVVDLELVRFEQEPNNAKILDNVFRLVHTIKGTCGFLNLPRLETLAHAAEALMGKFRDGAPATGNAVTLILTTIDRIKEILETLEAEQREPEGVDDDLIAALERMAASVAPDAPAQVPEQEAPEQEVPEPAAEAAARPPQDVPAEPENAPSVTQAAEAPASDNTEGQDGNGKAGHQSIRVNVDMLEHLMTMVSELVLTRNQLLEIVRRHTDSEFKAPLQRLSNVTAELQEGVMKTRMQPIGNAWQKLPRIVRDLSNELGKQINLEMQGAETELDRQVLDLIKDPLTHMVRNSADHGLETPAARRAAGKPEQGLIRLSAYHEGGHIIIQISDDGCGLDTARIKAKAVARGMVSEADAEKLSESQIHKFIFVPGFSTAAQVTSISGRGVGMDVVRANIDQIGGAIDVKSVAGVGLSFTIKIPLTLAIVAALIVEAGGDHFAIPQMAVVELVRTRNSGDHRIERIRDTSVLRLRDKLVPLARLTEMLGIDDGNVPETGYVVVTQVGSQTFGVMVDAVFHTEEIVVKPMSSKLRHIPMFSGNTILGDGSVIMIVDPNGIAQALGSTVSAQLAVEEAAVAPDDDADAEMTSLLVFRAGSTRPMAVPLSLVTRLGGDRRAQDRSVERPPYGAVPRPAHAVGEHERERAGEGRGRAAALGVLRRQPLHGAGGRRDRRHRRGLSRHPGGGRQPRRARLRHHQGPRDRDRRRRPFPAACLRGLVPPQGAAGRGTLARGAADRRLAFLPQHADAGLAGRGLRRECRRLRPRGACAHQ